MTRKCLFGLLNNNWGIFESGLEIHADRIRIVKMFRSVIILYVRGRGVYIYIFIIGISRIFRPSDRLFIYYFFFFV